MNDNEIIKALECCMTIEGNSCDGCPIEKGCISDEGVNILHKHALDLINRQKAEIEKLTVNKNAYGLGMQRLSEQLETVKSEAIKEFAERLKSKTTLSTLNTIGRKMVDIADIDNLVKEMTEQSTGYGSSKTER